jgi:hypothetical protein
MKKTVLFAVVLALAAMAIEPLGWLFAGKPGAWVHREAAYAIGIIPVAIGAVCWQILRWHGRPGF